MRVPEFRNYSQTFLIGPWLKHIELDLLDIHMGVPEYGKSRTEHPRNISPDIPRNLTKNTLMTQYFALD